MVGIIGCDNCPFKTKKIGGRGPYESPFVIVGESPGSTELAKGMPFMGPSGKMLNDVLAEVGLPKDIEPYVTNALSCYPMDKDIPKMQAATQCCQGRLHQELKAHPRKVILCLGASAAWAVTGDYKIKITRDRGKVLPSPLASAGVVLAVHPAYLMRNGFGLPFWKQDIKSAIDLMGDVYSSNWEEPVFQVIKNRAQLRVLVKMYTRAELIAADYETDGLSALFDRVLTLGITKDGKRVHIIPEAVYYDNLDLIKELMEGPSKWIWHNGKFDIQWAWASGQPAPQYPEPAPREHAIEARCDEDTMLLSYALNENAGFHDLDQVAQNWIGAPSHKSVMDKYYKMGPYYSLRGAPKQELYQYTAYDISKTFRMFKPLREAVNADPRLRRLYENTLIPATYLFARMERFGVLVDRRQVEENVVHEDTEIIQIDEKLQEYARQYLGREINFGSFIQVRELLYRAMKLAPNGVVSDWQNRSSNEDALVDIQRRTNHPIIHHMLQFREVKKRRGTYVINLIDHWVTPANQKKPKLVKGIISPDGRIHASYKIHGTTSGRPACTNPNMLNQPRIAFIRNQYEAREDYVLVEIDLNQAELRSLCVLSKDKLLTKIYRENKVSIHDVTTAEFFSSEEEMRLDPQKMHIAADLMQYFGERTPKLVYKEAKMAGKTVNFGIVYGREAASIAQVFNIPHQEAQRWIDTWFATYPEAAAYIRQCRATVLRNQRMVTPWGRMKRVGVVPPEKVHDLQNQAANFPHQSIAHDILLETALECEDWLWQNCRVRYWNEVYDAIHFEMPADDDLINAAIDYTCKVITEVPVRYGLTHIPFIGEAKVGYKWGNLKDWKGSLSDTLGDKLAA